MRQLVRPAVALLVLFFPSLTLAEPPGIYALTGGRIHPVSSPVIENGTVIIRDGLIEAVGASVDVPADAMVIELEGLNVYPGLFDAQTTFAIPAAASPAAATSPSPADPTASTEALKLLRITPELLDAKRATGVTTILVAPREGNFNGLSAILNLGDGSPESLVLRAPASTQIAFNTKSWGNFPDSLMGAIYHARQTLLDAKWLIEADAIYARDPRGRRRPERSADLEALAPALRREIPVVFLADDQVRIRRAADIAKELDVRWVVSGATEAWEMADFLASSGAPVLVSVNYPRKPGINADDQSLRQIRDRVLSPTGAAELARRNATFALVSGADLSPGGFIDGIRKTIRAGLAEDAALRAVTLTPARIFGVDRQIGSLERGKIANVLVTEKKFWENGARVRHLFVDGRAIRLPKEKAPAEDDASEPASGTWSLTLRMPDGEVFLQVVLAVEGDRLTGSFSGGPGSGSIQEGSVQGSSVSFSITAEASPGAETSDWRFSGTIEGSSMSGQVTNSLGTFEFSGRKSE